jgi:glycerol-3-phosphate acyltransferase PlsX
MARIAIDAMGGDLAPREIVLGAIAALEHDAEVVLVGDPAPIRAVLSDVGVDAPVVPATELIAMGEDPAAAIREKKDASVSVAARLVAAGEADGMVSAGSTGAALAAAVFGIGRIPGVSRPGIATILPIERPTVVLDAGANLAVKPEHLAQFAVMGAVMASIYLGYEDPAVGLLNIGSEAGKGRDLEKEAFALLEAAPIRFVGNVEGNDLGTPVADVLVTDGFTGNVLLKTVEATARGVGRMALEALTGDGDPSTSAAVETVMPRIAELQARLDPEAYGGAHLLGARGTVVICHGSSTRVAVANAVTLAAEGAARGMVATIEEQLARG